jgi:hypothetical protein
MSPKPLTHNKVRFPLWRFLTQPIFDPGRPVHLNPHQFWAYYQIQHLERCWTRNFKPEERYRNG